MAVTVIDKIEPKAEAFVTIVDAHRVADGSVTNSEFQTLSDISTASTIQTQLNGKSATTHNHNLADLTEKSHTSLTDKGTNTHAQIDSHLSDSLNIHEKTGVVKYWAGNIVNIPTGYLFCNGVAVSRTTYADLFAIVATKFGVGDGSTTFNIPDCRNLFVVGAMQDDAGIAKTNITGALLLTGGSTQHTHTLNWQHTHTFTGTAHSHTYGTIAVAAHAAHTHAYGTIAVAAHAAHVVSGSTAASSNTLTAECVTSGTCLPPLSHTHGYGTIAVAAHAAHVVSGSTNNPSAALTHTVSGSTATETAAGTNASAGSAAEPLTTTNIPPFIAFPAIIKT